jgi:hypothetical protein
MADATSEGLTMTKLLMAAAALSIASTAHAEEESKWRLHRTCSIITTDPNTEITFLTLEDALAIQKFIPDLKKCDAFWKCVADREAGKVKHCYANDRRWR